MTTTYDLQALSEATGVSAFAIRHMVTSGLVPFAVRQGSQGHYEEHHVHCILAIQRLRANHVRGAPLRARITSASPEEIRELAGVAPAEEPAPSEAALRDAVDSLVLTLAEALDTSPRALRPALAAMFTRMHEVGVSAEHAARVVATKR